VRVRHRCRKPRRHFRNPPNRHQRVPAHRVLEREALQAHGVGALAFTGGQATDSETADIVLRLLLTMANIAISEPRPFMYTFGLSSPLARVPSRLLR